MVDVWGYNNQSVARKVVCVLWGIVLVTAIPIAGRRVNLKEAGQSVPWRPPSGAYGPFWTVLILCLLSSWVLVTRVTQSTTDFIVLALTYFLTVTSCVAWLFVYVQKKVYGIVAFVVLLCVWSVLAPFAFSQQPLGGALLGPLGVWALFQLAVNCRELEEPR